ncbi:hypothetical protein THOM_2164 [Trachipleistophora hominis]|uniref:Uncharacterized protein n=1 Tax=Trachipleistophora hominis TaxID=72359 RepID=L7JTV5_TRAHO|nr:hypothetical protein THOM_2164 [Trachipleistophora hominis]
MSQLPHKKIKLHKDKTKYLKRSKKDKSIGYRLTKEINRKMVDRVRMRQKNDMEKSK